MAKSGPEHRKSRREDPAMNQVPTTVSESLAKAKLRLGDAACNLLRGDELDVLDTAVILSKRIGVLEAIPETLKKHKISADDGLPDKQVAAYRSLITFALSLDAPEPTVHREEAGPGMPPRPLDWMKDVPKPAPEDFQGEIERRYP